MIKISSTWLFWSIWIRRCLGRGWSWGWSGTICIFGASSHAYPGSWWFWLRFHISDDACRTFLYFYTFCNLLTNSFFVFDWVRNVPKSNCRGFPASVSLQCRDVATSVNQECRRSPAETMPCKILRVRQIQIFGNLSGHRSEFIYAHRLWAARSLRVPKKKTIDTTVFWSSFHVLAAEGVKLLRYCKRPRNVVLRLRNLDEKQIIFHFLNIIDGDVNKLLSPQCPRNPEDESHLKTFFFYK